MPWSTARARGTNPKYRTKRHRDYRGGLVQQLEHDGYLICTAIVCVFATRVITNPDGRARDGLHAGHEDNGIDYRGPEHAACNLRDGAIRSNHPKVARCWEL